MQIKIKGYYIMKDLIASTGIVGFIIIFGLIFLWPLAIIWALNTLFMLGIAYTFWTWLAVLILTISFGKANVNKKD
jgi:hypothetical protein